MSEKCSVIVLNYNGKRFLEECLTSLKNQTYNDYKVYVVDNASTDGSAEFIRNNFPWVSVIESKENFGTAGGSNLGASNTKGEYIILTSNDIKVDKCCIENFVKTFENDPKVGICTSKLLKYVQDLKTGRHLIDNAGGIIDKFAFPTILRTNEVNEENENSIEKVFFSCGGCFIIRRELFEKIGGFDSKYFTLSDDVDLSWRAWLAGYKVAVNHSAIIYHKVSATLGPLFAKAQKRFWSERNNLRTILKNYEFFTLIIILPQYFFLLFMEACFYLVTLRWDLFFAIVKAGWWNIVNFPDTMRMRKKVGSFRTVRDEYILGKMHKGSIKIKMLFEAIRNKAKI